MPGKQMAIDADLNAGLIDQSQAKLRRLEVAQEAESTVRWTVPVNSCAVTPSPAC